MKCSKFLYINTWSMHVTMWITLFTLKWAHTLPIFIININSWRIKEKQKLEGTEAGRKLAFKLMPKFKTSNDWKRKQKRKFSVKLMARLSTAWFLASGWFLCGYYYRWPGTPCLRTSMFTRPVHNCLLPKIWTPIRVHSALLLSWILPPVQMPNWLLIWPGRAIPRVWSSYIVSLKFKPGSNNLLLLN